MDGKRDILYVEDDPIEVGNLQRAFSRAGIAKPLRTAPNGEEALRLLRGGTGEAGALRPRIILLDLGMPRMGGLEFLREVKSDPALRPIPIIVLSASKHEADLQRAYELGAAGYVVKPYHPAEFSEAARTIERYWSLCEIP